MVRFTYKQRVVHTSCEGIVCGGNPASSSPSDAPSYNSQHFAQISQDNSDLWRPDWYLGMRAEVSISVCVSGRRDSVGVLWETSDWGRWRHLALISVSVSHWQSGGTGLARLLCWATHYTLPNTTISLSLSHTKLENQSWIQRSSHSAFSQRHDTLFDEMFWYFGVLIC